jgi:phosphoenolpyruvate carboxykinase (ATP)
VAKLTKEQTAYHFITGYTAKVAGTELGIKEPVPSFSACFGAAFLTLDPIIYANELLRKMDQHDARAWLVNTGWIGGGYGVGRRMDLPSTRQIIDEILNGNLLDSEYETLPIFNLAIPRTIAGEEAHYLNPRGLWENKTDWDKTAKHLGQLFINNFQQFTDNPQAMELVAAGPVLV